MAALEDDLEMVAAQPGDGYIPKHPTDGWVFHELRALNIDPRPLDVEQRLRRLRDLGYPCTKFVRPVAVDDDVVLR